MIYILSFFAIAGCLPEGFSYLSDMEPSIIQEMRYYGIHNFMGKRASGYLQPICILTTSAAYSLKLFQQELLKRNLTLKVYDCYRPQAAVADFVKWSKNYTDTKMKVEFYPTLDKDQLFPNFIATQSGHSRGSTVDLTLVPLPIPKQPEYHEGDPLYPCYSKQRFQDNSINAGSGFDCFHEISHTNSTIPSAEEQGNRQFLKRMMEEFGFKNYPDEWWHYTLKDQPFPSTYFNFSVV